MVYQVKDGICLFFFCVNIGRGDFSHHYKCPVSLWCISDFFLCLTCFLYPAFIFLQDFSFQFYPVRDFYAVSRLSLAVANQFCQKKFWNISTMRISFIRIVIKLNLKSAEIKQEDSFWLCLSLSNIKDMHYKFQNC